MVASAPGILSATNAIKTFDGKDRLLPTSTQSYSATAALSWDHRGKGYIQDIYGKKVNQSVRLYVLTAAYTHLQC